MADPSTQDPNSLTGVDTAGRASAPTPSSGGASAAQQPLSTAAPSPSTPAATATASSPTSATTSASDTSVGGPFSPNVNLPAPALAPEASTEARLTGLLRNDSDLMEQARTQGEQSAAQRGLLNSSIAVGAAQDAATRAALPIASEDASRAFQQGQSNLQTQQASALSGQEFAQSKNLAAFNAQSAQSLAQLETGNRLLLQTSSAAQQAYGQMGTQISTILQDTSLDQASKVNAVNSLIAYYQQYFDTQSALLTAGGIQSNPGSLPTLVNLPAQPGGAPATIGIGTGGSPSVGTAPGVTPPPSVPPRGTGGGTGGGPGPGPSPGPGGGTGPGTGGGRHPGGGGTGTGTGTGPIFLPKNPPKPKSAGGLLRSAQG